MSTFTYDPAVTIPTLIGSILSCIASGFIFICYLILPRKPHFRHILILNLAAADFSNSLNNSISGIWFVEHGYLSRSVACTANGFVGQLTVQATDFSILLIAIFTVLALRGSSSVHLPTVTRKNQAIAFVCVWTVPVITSSIGLFLKAYGPVSGNWCWIESEHQALRYALNHGWRFAIVLATCSLYGYLYFYLRREIKEIRQLHQLSPIQEGITAQDIWQHQSIKPEQTPKMLATLMKDAKYDDDFVMREKEFADQSGMYGNGIIEEDSVPVSSSRVLTNFASYEISLAQANKYDYKHTASLHRRQSEIQKVLLLNSYPIAYVILWLPGIINRIIELGGSSSRTMRILQSATQYVGLANAITYGWNEGIWRQAQEWWELRKGGRR